MSNTRFLALDVLRLDADVQSRETMSSGLIEDYAQLYAEGHELPPIKVSQDGPDYWVADGFHRTKAARKTGLSEIPADVEIGTKRDAIVYACGSNKHGKPRSHEDKRRAVRRLLNDPEWRQWSNLTIARHCGVTASFVGKLRSSLGIESSEQRRYITRHGTEAVMDTSSIGKRALSEPTTAAADDLARTDIEARYPAQEPIPARETPPLILTVQAVPNHRKRPTFNQTNEMVDWAKWTWNPVTGCEHTCVYCYARDIAERFYPEKFAPTFRPERLKAPHFTKLPPKADTQIGWRNVFVCSMADLFGKWVPQEWIDAVLEEVWAAPQWNFLFLTKFPQRLAAIEWPENAWVGTTVDEQYRVKIAERAFRDVKAPVRWLSCEPLRERLTFDSLEMFDWVVIGGQSASTQAPAFQPPWEWVEHLMAQARTAKCQVYWKPNLTVRPQEYPGMSGLTEGGPDAVL
jgi:protein gp37